MDDIAANVNPFSRGKQAVPAKNRKNRGLFLTDLQVLDEGGEPPDDGEAQHQNVQNGGVGIDGADDPVVHGIADGGKQQHSERNFHRNYILIGITFIIQQNKWGVNSGKHSLRKRKPVISLTANSQNPNLPPGFFRCASPGGISAFSVDISR